MKLNYIPHGSAMINYDDIHDVMVVRFGNSQRTYVDDMKEIEGFSLIKDMESDAVNGIQCFDYKAKARQNTFENLLKQHSGIHIPMMPLQPLYYTN